MTAVDAVSRDWPSPRRGRGGQAIITPNPLQYEAVVKEESNVEGGCVRRRASAVVLIAGLVVTPVLAAEPGKAVGTVTIDKLTVNLSVATEAKVENLFDSKKQDTLVVLTDKPLGASRPDDEVGLSLRARTGELVVVALRLDGASLVNVKISHKGLSGFVTLPGAWFQYSGSKPGIGTLKLNPRAFDGRTYACAAEFAAAPAAKPVPTAPAATPAPPATRATEPEKLPPATTSNIDKKSATALLVQAMQDKDERRAIELIKLGADPNGRDQSGTPVLNWAIMMCQPSVVQALVNAKADLTYQRAPGLTPLVEAGACPAAAKILQAAGAK